MKGKKNFFIFKLTHETHITSEKSVCLGGENHLQGETMEHFSVDSHNLAGT